MSTREPAVLRVRRLRAEDADIPLPRYASSKAAGLDLAAAVPESVVLAPGARALIPTGFAIELPIGHEGQVRPRSGLARKHGVTLLNSPGTIDQDYRGEVCVLLVNLGYEPFEVTRGMRIAQLVVAPVTQTVVLEASHLSGTERGSGGFGHTGD